MKTKHNNNMKNSKRFIVIIIIFFILSINSIYSFTKFITDWQYSLIIKQTIFYLIGILSIFIMLKFNPKKLLDYSLYLYIFNVSLLILVLFIGTELNGTRAWFSLPLIGTIQPSEFMKIGLILYLAKVIDKTKLNNYKDEIKLIFKVLLITIIPSIVTFLEPDTGAVLIYFIIALAMLFASKLRIRYFLILFGGILIVLISLLYLYTTKQDLFITIFGSNMFYRLDRIFDWKSSSGMQLENSILSIGSSKTFGNGINNINLYFPEGHTDFIFASLASIYGFTGMIILIITIIAFDYSILNIRSKENSYNLIVIGFFSAIFYQQIQNISMTIGLLPITGITLPFISYGGSSLISYMILLGIIFSINKKELT